MKNSFRIILVLLAAGMLCSGCDFFRSLAGRPTSEDIAAKRAQIEEVAAKRAQAMADSLQNVKAAQKAQRDSISAAQRLSELSVNVISRSSLGGVLEPSEGKGYCIVVGSFKERANAERMAQKVQGYGFSPLILHFRNGMYAVGVCSCGKISEIAAEFEKVKNEKFCPKDAWILLND